jgi:uncharacterized membrane protein (UPF0127 family)
MRVFNRNSGKELAWNLTVAETFFPRLRGLLGRQALALGEGLLIRPCKGVHTAFMKFPIDVLFLDQENRVIETINDLQPHRLTKVRRSAACVIELPAGTIRASSTAFGDIIAIDWKRPLPDTTGKALSPWSDSFYRLRDIGRLSPGLLPLLALSIFLSPLLTRGLPQGHDWFFELVRVSEFKSALADGQFPPYWAENLYHGRGSPIFIFYAPLYLLSASLCSDLTGSISSGCALALVIFSLTAVGSVNFLLSAALNKESFENASAARVAVYFYILNPYLICDLYLRNANAEFAALCVAPLAFGAVLIMERKARQGGLLLAAGLALAIIAHNLSALLVFAMVITASLAMHRPRGKLSRLGAVIGSIALGLALSAFFWLPSLYYKSQVQIEQLTSGKFDFHDQFQPIDTFFGYGSFFSSGLLTPLVLLFGVEVIWLAHRRRESTCIRALLFALSSAFVFLFLQTRAAVFIWDTLCYMKFFQFPWRMMGPLALATAMVAGLSFAYLCRGKSKGYVFCAEIVFLFLCIMNAIPHLQDSLPLAKSVARKLPHLLLGETINKQGFAATVRDEYLPRLARADSRDKTGFTGNKGAGNTIWVLKESGSSISLETNAKFPGKAQVARWYFPGWQCTINGERHGVGSSESGLIEIPVPAGCNRITLQLKAPLLRLVSVWISLVSLAVWCGALILPQKNMPKAKE